MNNTLKNIAAIMDFAKRTFSKHFVAVTNYFC